MKFHHKIIKYHIPIDHVEGSVGKIPEGNVVGKPFSDLKKAFKKAELLNEKAMKANNLCVGYFVKSEVLN